MNMKYMNAKKLFLFTALGGILLFSSCSKMTETRPLFETDLTRNSHVDQDGSFIDPANVDALVARDRVSPYYTDLREWKLNTDHEVSFGWFGNWTGKGLNYEFSLRGLPDSTDFVSLWGGWHSIDPIRRADLKYVQEVKGTRALACILMFQIGDAITPPIPKDLVEQKVSWNEWQHRYWGWTVENASGQWETTQESIDAAIVKYANAVADTISFYGLDGLDIDAEPSYGQPFETNYELWRPSSRMDLFVKTIGERIGPMAKTEEGKRKLLVIDGEPHAISAEYGKYFNYFIIQAYGDSSPYGLNQRYQTQVDHFGGALSPEEISKKMIYCANFESFAITGGGANYKGDPKLIWMAKHRNQHEGNSYRKGGVGTFHMEYEYKLSNQKGTYPYLRQAIQVMNPAIN